MPKVYRASLATHVRNALILALLRSGVRMGKTSQLTLQGRRTGALRTVALIPLDRDGERFLVAPYGEVQWVRNLRAAGTARLTRGHVSEMITATELSARQAAPVLKQYLSEVVWVRPYFDVAPDAPLDAFEREASRHPVFQIAPTPTA